MEIGDVDSFWKAYQTGQGSADHTDREVFAEVVGPLIEYARAASTEGEIANARNSELLAENQIMYRALDRTSRSVAGSPHLVKLARGALERVSGRRNND